MQAFLDMLSIARKNIEQNPSLQGRSKEAVAHQYLNGLMDEVKEVRDEIRPNNQIFLEDELSDIAWDYACLLAQLERSGFIENAEAVLEHGLSKYTERAPAFLQSSEEMWDAVKTKQKATLKQKHLEKYGT